MLIFWLDIYTLGEWFHRVRGALVVIIVYLCNQCLSPLTLWVRILHKRGTLDTTLCDKVRQWLATGRWFSPGTPVSSTNKTDRHDITETLLKVAINTINLYKPLSLSELSFLSPNEYFFSHNMSLHPLEWLIILTRR